MSKYKPVLGAMAFLVVIFCYWFFYLRNAEGNKLRKESNAIVAKIEDYKKTNGRLPSKLEEVGINVIDEANPPINYAQLGMDGYMVWYSFGFDDDNIYYSDTKQWESSFRKVK